MRVDGGLTCFRDFRSNTALSYFPSFIKIEAVKLVAAPQSGQVTIKNAGFSYTANSGFRGKDLFVVEVFGEIGGSAAGSSTIRVSVSVNSSTGVLEERRLPPQPAPFTLSNGAPKFPAREDARLASPLSDRPTVFAPLPIGGGGYVTGIQITGSAMVSRSNAGGAFSWNGSHWVDVVGSDSLPKAVVSPNGNASGVTEIQMAPSATSTIYMKFRGYVLVSTNSGGMWTDTGLTRVPDNDEDPNAPNSGTSGPLLAVDPVNPDIVIDSFPGTSAAGGLYYTLNGTRAGGATWVKISGVPKVPGGHTANYTINYDPTSSTLGGVKQGIFACASTMGCYHTIAGPAGPWISIGSDGPTEITQSIVDPLGNLWTYGNGIWRWVHGTWTKVLANNACGGACGSITIDPKACFSLDACHVFVLNFAGDIMVSTNGGSTFAGPTPNNHSIIASDIPWLAVTDQSFMSASGYAQMDSGGRLWMGAGTGVFSTTPPTSNVTTTPLIWTSHTATQETLVGNFVVSPPGGRPVAVSWDRAAIYSESNSRYPSTQAAYAGIGVGIMGGWGADYVYGSPSTLALLASNNNGGLNGGLTYDLSGISIDGGQTFTPFGAKSSTSNTFGRGSKTWTTASDLSISVGENLLVIDATDQSHYGNAMAGAVTSYSRETGSLTLSVSSVCAYCRGSSNSWIIHTVPPPVINRHPGGCIAAIGTTKFVWLPGDGAEQVWYTTNGGSIWAPIPGLPSDGWGSFQFNKRNQRCAADRSVADRFYLYNTGFTAPGFYACTLVTAPSCTRVFAGRIQPDFGFPCIKSIPGNAGYLFFSSVGKSNFSRSVDGGAHWSAVADRGNNFTNVNAFGFGAAFPNQSFPAIYLQGNDGTAFGFYRSIDNGLTWTVLAQWPAGNIDILDDIDGDKTTPGTVYGATISSGYYYGRLNFLLKRDLSPATHDNDPMWLTKTA